MPNKIKKSHQRSASYPGFPLPDVVEATKLLKDKLGQGNFSRESAAQALGYSGVNGASATKIAACVHFGFLTREGNVYKQASLSDQFFLAVSEEEKQQALLTAVKTPTLYQKLIETYKDSALPKMLDHILIRNYGITEKAAKKAADNFIKSAEYAGILSNGILAGLKNIEQNSQSLRTKSTNKEVKAAGHVPMVASQDFLSVLIPNTEVTILFPSRFAYDLSIGSFREGIEKLAANIQTVTNKYAKEKI